MVVNLQFFGGRGSSSGIGGRGMSLAGFLKNFRNADENSVGKLGLKVGKPQFTENGNSIKLQSATVENGADKVEVSFYSDYNPMQKTNSNSNISTIISVRHYKDGNIQAIKNIVDKKTKSVKNAKKNYDSVLERWKKITKQKSIKF